MKKIDKSTTKDKVVSKKPKKVVSRSKTTMFGIIGIAFLGIFNFQGIVDNYVGMGLAAVPSYVFAVLFFLTPFALIISELSSLKKVEKSESGLNAQINVS
jgi:hypothetical protein